VLGKLGCWAAGLLGDPYGGWPGARNNPRSRVEDKMTKRTLVVIVAIAAVLLFMSQVFCSQESNASPVPRTHTSWARHPWGATYRTTSLSLCPEYGF
jgi:hypothetical protein